MFKLCELGYVDLGSIYEFMDSINELYVGDTPSRSSLQPQLGRWPTPPPNRT